MPKGSWGGARPHLPGREGGRPRRKYPPRPAMFQATDKEWAEFLNLVPSDTRKKFEFVIRAVEVSTMSYASELVRLWKEFYRRPDVKPLTIAAETIREADKRLFSDEQSLQEVVWGTLLKELHLPDSKLIECRTFANYFVSVVFLGQMRGDESLLAPGSKQLRLLKESCQGLL